MCFERDVGSLYTFTDHKEICSTDVYYSLMGFHDSDKNYDEEDLP